MDRLTIRLKAREKGIWLIKNKSHACFENPRQKVFPSKNPLEDRRGRGEKPRARCVRLSLLEVVECLWAHFLSK